MNGGPPGTGCAKEFEDNVDGNAIDPAKWDVLDQVEAHPSGSKPECLTLAKNVTVKDGICSLTTKRKQIDSVHKYTSGSLNTKYKIVTSTDDSIWTMGLDHSSTMATGQVVSDSFYAVKVRYIRITITGLPLEKWAGISEMEVYGNDESTMVKIIAVKEIFRPKYFGNGIKIADRILTTFETMKSITFYSHNGKKILSQSFENGTTSLPLAELQKGLSIVQIKFLNGSGITKKY